MGPPFFWLTRFVTQLTQLISFFSYLTKKESMSYLVMVQLMQSRLASGLVWDTLPRFGVKSGVSKRCLDKEGPASASEKDTEQS